MNNLFDKLKQKWDEDPLQVLVVGALVVTATAKLMDARTNAVNRRVWAREVDRRIMKTR